MKNTCFGCIERFVGCHSTCETYLDFKQQKEELQKLKHSHSELENYFVNSIARRTRTVYEKPKP